MDDAIIDYIRKLVNTVKSNNCDDFENLFSLILKDKSNPLSPKEMEYFRPLHGVFSFYYHNTKEAPYGPMIVNGNMRSMIPDDLTDQELAKLDILANIKAPDAFLARVNDVLWIRNRDSRHAKFAVSYYIKCLGSGVNHDFLNWGNYAKRVSQIAAELGTKAEEREIVRKILLRLFKYFAKRNKDGHHWAWDRTLAEILIDQYPEIDRIFIAEQCTTIASRMSSPMIQESYYETAIKAFRKVKDMVGVRAVYKLMGDSWEADAKRFMSPSGGNGLQMAHRIEKAIECYRQAGEKKKAEALLPELQYANKLSIGQMESIGVSLDMTEIMNEVVQSMKDKVGLDALYSFIGLTKPLSYKKEYQEAESQGQKPRLMDFASSTTLVTEGNVVARSDGGLEINDDKILMSLIDQYGIQQKIVAAMFDRGRNIILDDKVKQWVPAIIDLIEQSNFVPEDRREIFSRAIVGGMEGDFLLFTHLIIPQIEQSVRMMVGKIGGKTTSLRDGLMKERNLNQLLTEKDPDNKDAFSAFGDDITWELRTILVEQSGPNLRNRVCHGLATNEQLNGYSARYLLWLILFIIAHFRESTA